MATYLFTEYLYDAVPRVSKQIQTVDKIHRLLRFCCQSL